MGHRHGGAEEIWRDLKGANGVVEQPLRPDGTPAQETDAYNPAKEKVREWGALIQGYLTTDAFLLAATDDVDDGVVTWVNGQRHRKAAAALATSTASIKDGWEFYVLPDRGALSVSVQPSRGEGSTWETADGGTLIELASTATDADVTTSGGVKLDYQSVHGTTKIPAQASVDDAILINRILQRNKKDRTTAFQQGVETELLDFGGKTARIRTPIVGVTGAKFRRLNLEASASMTRMVETEDVDAFEAAAQDDKHLYQEYFFGFDEECTINAKGFDMTSGWCVKVACDWGTIDHLTVVGIDDSDDILPGVNAFYWGAVHPPSLATVPRNFFAESKLKFLKTARFSGGAHFAAVDCILDSYLGQAHTDFCFWEEVAVDLGFAHIYGALPEEFPAGAADRGLGYVAAAQYGGVRRTKVLTIETTEKGLVFGNNFSYAGKFECYFYKQRIADVTALSGVTQISVQIDVADGARAEGAGASERGRGNTIYLPAGTKFVDSEINLVGYGGNLDFEADRTLVQGNLVPRSRTADGLEASAKIPAFVRGNHNRITGVMHGQFGVSDDQDFTIAGDHNTVDLTLASGTAIPNIKLGDASRALNTSSVKLNGDFTRESVNLGASCDISSGAGANHAPSVVSASGGVIDLLAAENSGLHPHYFVDTDSGSVTLTDITGGINGQTIILSVTTNGNPLTITHNSNFRCPGGADLTLANDLDSVELKYRASKVAWIVQRVNLNSSV